MVTEARHPVDFGRAARALPGVLPGIVAAAVIVAIVVSSVVASIRATSSTGVGTGPLEVFVRAQPAAAGEWTLDGRVITDGETPEQLQVWAIVQDDLGNRYSPPAVQYGESGSFTIPSVPQRIGGATAPLVSKVTVFAKTGAGDDAVRGQEVLTFGDSQGIRRVQIPLTALVFIPAVFALSILFALVHAAPSTWRIRAKYYGAVVLAFVFTLVMVTYIALGLQFVNTTGSPGEVLSLGFANFYHGTYVQGVQPEWLISLTSPITQASEATGPQIAGGFGAPLWVVFLSVVGAGVFTIAILVNEIKNPVDLADQSKVRSALHLLVRHQFYILFAPLGAIVVYQLLVAATSATNQVTVGVTALAAGLAVTLISERALNLVQGLVAGKQ